MCRNKVFRIVDAQTGINYPPMHPFCRSTTVPYFPPDEFDTPSVRAARDSEGKYYTVHADMSYKKWYDKYVNRVLTDAEEYAINTYIGPVSYIINDKLRSGEKLSAIEQELVNNLDSALNKLPVYEGTVQRSMFFDSKEKTDLFLRTFLDDKVPFPAFTSASVGIVYDDSDKVRLIIKSKTAADMRRYNKNEQEVLFKRGTVFRPTKMELVDGKPFVYLEEVI